MLVTYISLLLNFFPLQKTAAVFSFFKKCCKSSLTFHNKMDFFHSPNFTCNKFIKNLTLILLLGKIFYINFIAYPSNSCQGARLPLVLVVRMEAVRVVILF